MIRTQVQLTEDQAKRLRMLAAERGESVAALVREAVEELLQNSGKPSWHERWKRSLNALGCVSGPGDLAERHDDYLAEAIESKWRSS